VKQGLEAIRSVDAGSGVFFGALRRIVAQTGNPAQDYCHALSLE
jgi:hypothetical protein